MRDRCPGCRCLTSSALDLCPECRMRENEDANEKYHQDDLRAFEGRTYPSPGDVPDKEPS